MPFVSGENVGPYRIIEKLGQGGMATVYKAYHAALDRNVALKVLHPAFKEDPQFLERFHREAKLVARLEHPNIVPIYDFAEHMGQPYLVMKFIPGETLKARLQHSPVNLAEGNHILQAVGDALTYAHREGVLHRDVKPSNILLADDARIYLADFGLARIAELGASTLPGDMLFGTPHYISPEQARGEKDLDERTDIYSLGIVMYELVVGQVPFSADTPFSIIHDHIYTPLPLPCEVNPAVPSQIQSVLLKALAKDREDRFESVKQMVDAYTSAVEGAGAVQIPPVDLTDTMSKELEVQYEDQKVEAVSDKEPSKVPVVSDEGVHELSKKSKRNFNWVWITIGVMITFVSLVAMAAVANRPGMKTLFDEGAVQNVPTRTSRVDAPLETAVINSSALATSVPSDLPAQPRPEPSEHLAKADELVGEGKQEEASQEYIIAGELFLQLDQPVDAAESLIQAAILQGELDREEDLKLISLLTQSLFFSAPYDEIDHLIETFPNMYARMPFLRLLEARRLIFTGEYEKAQRILDDTLTRDPNSYLAKAIQAELLYSQGDLLGASKNLSEALNAPAIYPWLYEHLIALDKKISTVSS